MKKLTNESALSLEEVYNLEHEVQKSIQNDSYRSKKRLFSAFDKIEWINNRTYLIHHLANNK